MKLQVHRRQVLSFAWVTLAACSLAVVSPGSRSGALSEASPASPKVKVAYLGLTCEAAIFVAYEKGFFKDEGLDIELVKTDWDGLRDGLGLGRFDANYTLIMYLLKPIEQGLDVKITGSVHSGCLRVQAGLKSSIKSVEDLKGKRIGVPTNLGSPPFLLNPIAAAELSVDKRYIAASSEVNAHAISKLRYAPGISRCRSSLDLAAAEMKTAGLLKASTDPSELAKRAWLDLDGVTDEWIKGLKIERVAGGGRPPLLDDRAFVALLAGQPVSCCNGK